MPFTYAIADLHGRNDLLSEAVTKIVEHSKSDRPATIITLGDYVDRGPKSRQVIERLMDWGSPDLKLVAQLKCLQVAFSRFANDLCCRFHLLIFTLRFIPAPSASNGKGQEDQADDRISNPHSPSQGLAP